MLEDLEYAGNILIEDDLKRLKRWSSLETDVHNCYKIIAGSLNETRWPPSYNFCGGLITKIVHSEKTLLCFKERQAITEPQMTPEEGARIIYALVVEIKKFIPLLVFSASEEKTMYKIGKKKFLLTKSNFAKIITEKIRLCLK